MIVGDPSVFAIQSEISEAFERPSFRALGSFTILVKGRRYGVFKPDATMLACSLNAVEKRIRERGRHTAEFANKLDARSIADGFRCAFYMESHEENYLGLTLAEFAEQITSRDVLWAPDGDEAFDDGSYVLQLDLEDRVRLIAFRCGSDGLSDPQTLSELWMASDDFYALLLDWRERFMAEWASLPKVLISQDQIPFTMRDRLS